MKNVKCGNYTDQSLKNLARPRFEANCTLHRHTHTQKHGRPLFFEIGHFPIIIFFSRSFIFCCTENSPITMTITGDNPFRFLPLYMRVSVSVSVSVPVWCIAAWCIMCKGKYAYTRKTCRNYFQRIISSYKNIWAYGHQDCSAFCQCRLSGDDVFLFSTPSAPYLLLLFRIVCVCRSHTTFTHTIRTKRQSADDLVNAHNRSGPPLKHSLCSVSVVQRARTAL